MQGVGGHLREGTTAPDFALKDQSGNLVRLWDLTERGPVVLYFYPKDETPGCTLEAHAFRDEYETFSEAGATVVGVSVDSIDSHRAFAENHQLPFTLLSDPDGRVHRLYGAHRKLGLLPQRVTYVIDQGATIRMVYRSQINMKRHAEEALKVLNPSA